MVPDRDAGWFLHPDWALVYKNDQTLYFVAETKDTGGKEGVNLVLLRPLEQLKIECGKRHFRQFEEIRFRDATQHPYRPADTYSRSRTLGCACARMGEE
jgi:restriction endonuclease